MGTGFCTRCGAVLRNGVCPRGHPQRAERWRPRKRRRWGRLVVLVLLLAIVAGGAYYGLVWYPARAAAVLMDGVAADYGEALSAYRAAVDALPEEGSDVEAAVGASEEILARADEARSAVTDAQVELQERDPPSVPVVSSRPPLGQAIETRDQMLAFYTGALEALVGLEEVASYLTEIQQTLPELDNLERALGEPENEAEVAEAVESGSPIAQQLLADLEALTPPEELGSVHATLVAVAQRIRADLEEAERAGSAAAELVATLLADVREEVDAYRQAVAGAPQTARESGLGRTMGELRDLADRIRKGLQALDNAGVPEITVPTE